MPRGMVFDRWLFLTAGLLVVGGLLSIPTLKQEVLPEISLDVVTVRVVYPGAAPVEIEEGICIRIEEELQGLQGVKRISRLAAT